MNRLDRKVSVIVPAYNGTLYIADAIRSACSQTVLPHEIIVVDDASTDGTAQEVERIAHDVPVLVRLIRMSQNSGGPARPINAGVEAAQCGLIKVLDQDDILEPCTLQQESQALNKNQDLSLAFSWCGIVGQEARCEDQKIAAARCLAAGQVSDACCLVPGLDVLACLVELGNFVVGYPGFMFRRRDWEEKGGVEEDLRFSSDFDLLCWLSQRGKVAMVCNIGYRRREHATNMSRHRLAMYREVAAITGQILSDQPAIAADRRLVQGLRSRHTKVVFSLYQDLKCQRRASEAMSVIMEATWNPKWRTLVSSTRLWASLVVPRRIRRFALSMAIRSPKKLGWVNRCLMY